MTDFAKNCLTAHNELRAKHGAPPLKLSDKLTAHAQKWADHLASTGNFEHSEGSGYGENIAMQWSSGGADVPARGAGMGRTSIAMQWSSGGADVPARSFVQQWYSELEKYDFGDKSGNFQPSAGHFSQVVWKGTKELGVGVAKDGKGMSVAVCNYNPAGNMQGDFGANVQAEK
ncbi:GLIPR2 [Branchiostoma lanceolatum]|uniref:GLIPR2 protein n=1 Tax=Branchiostoma lanceolatum TaxID=7740 RepID=A0A8K0AAX9_BRALA|nr:GLIPR2 [Branchiostoma lanceolatum]